MVGCHNNVSLNKQLQTRTDMATVGHSGRFVARLAIERAFVNAWRLKSAFSTNVLLLTRIYLQMS